uniref:Uncharacterized protein n=1 Tax=Hordeum vulgare subsp. vulgare TaxID=112509 RepID=A0A8I6YM83_HORVV
MHDGAAGNTTTTHRLDRRIKGRCARRMSRLSPGFGSWVAVGLTRKPPPPVPLLPRCSSTRHARRLTSELLGLFDTFFASLSMILVSEVSCHFSDTNATTTVFLNLLSCLRSCSVILQLPKI